MFLNVSFYFLKFTVWSSKFRIEPKITGLKGFYPWNSRSRNPSFPNFQISNFLSRKKWRKKTCQNAPLCTEVKNIKQEKLLTAPNLRNAIFKFDDLKRPPAKMILTGLLVKVA